MESDKEDNQKACVDSRVRTEWEVMSHTSQEEQSEVGHLSLLETCAAKDGLSRCQKRGVSSKARDKQSFEIQNNLRFRVRKEEPKKAHLRCVVAQNPCPFQGVFEGLCPLSFREQIDRPTVRNSHAAHRAKRKGMFAEKNKGHGKP